MTSLKGPMEKVPCVPCSLPPLNLDWKRLAPLISKAGTELGQYGGLLASIPNSNLLLSPLTSQEATLSSKIEGTQATLSEVLQYDAGQEESNPVKRKELEDIANYRLAISIGVKHLEERGVITLHLIRELHQIFIKDIDKLPGEFRSTQNWIGPANTPMTQARFIPPEPLIMGDALKDLQEYIDSDGTDAPLVDLAIVHAQFEIIHPFLDGNGRLGRLLIPLFLYQKKMLQNPSFYLSETLAKKDGEYRDGLFSITEHGDWQGWIEFFLNAVYTQACKNNEKIKLILQLYEDLKPKFREATNSSYAQPILDAFFKHPFINSKDIRETANIGHAITANQLLRTLANKKLIKLIEIGVRGRPALYVLPRLFNLIEGEQLIAEE